MSKRFLTLEEAKDFVFKSDTSIIQNGCENIMTLSPDDNNSDSETEDINDLNLGEEKPQDICGELEVFVKDEESEDEEFRPKN